MKTSVRILVSGRVQGVGFRYSCREQAVKFCLEGWVRNLVDGRVEIQAEGEEVDIQRFSNWCRCGPPHAFVSSCEELFGAVSGAWTGFEVRF